MKHPIPAAVAAAIGVIGLSVAYLAHVRAAPASVLTASATPHTVVVELFTSEGCSDCPPADAALAKIGMRNALPDINVIPLEEHVDYFNSRHWSDPFSQHAFTLRQCDYMRAFRNDDVYTPQMVIQGRTGFVGSDGARAHTEIDLSAHDSQFVPLTLTVRALPGKKLRISVNAQPSSSNSIEGGIYYAITQDGLSSDVTGGENRGHKLNHTAVVRRLERLSAYSSSSGANSATTIALRPETDIQALHVVAFIQRDNGGEILSGAQVDLKGLPADIAALSR